MAYSSELVKLVADQLSRFVNLNRHQLAGQASNLDFWLAQVRHALEAIDRYGERFVRMEGAQELYVVTHGVTEFNLKSEFPQSRKPAPPRRVPDRELKAARREHITAASGFLERCHKEGFIDSSRLRSAYDSLGVE